MPSLHPAKLILPILLASAFPCNAEGLIPEWGQIATPEERRKLEQEIKAQAARNGRNEQTLDNVARYVGGRFPELSGSELVNRVGEIAKQLKQAQDELEDIISHKKEVPTYIFVALSKADDLISMGEIDGAHSIVKDAISRAENDDDFNIQEYVKLLSLFAKLTNLQQDPMNASFFLHEKSKNLTSIMKDLQAKLYREALDVEISWAERTQSETAGNQALRSLTSLIALNDPSIFSRNLSPSDYENIDFPFFIGARKGVCQVANIYLIASNGEDLALIKAGISQFDEVDLSPIDVTGKNWECQMVLGQLEAFSGAVSNDYRTFKKGINRINEVLDFYAQASFCPINFDTFGVAIYRFARLFESKRVFFDNYLENEDWKLFILNLKFASKSLLPSPPPVDLVTYVSLRIM